MTDSGPKAWNKKTPLWTDKAVSEIKKILKSGFKVFEWGSGASTIWLAKQVLQLVSIEHDPTWYKLVTDALVGAKLSNVTLKLLDRDSGAYVESIREHPDGFFDFVFIDGRQRVACIEEALSKIRVAGFLLVDDSQRDRYQKGIVLLADWSRTDFPWKKRQTTIWQK